MSREFVITECRPPYSTELRQQMLELVKIGKAAKQLEKEFGCSAKTIKSWVAQEDRSENNV